MYAIMRCMRSCNHVQVLSQNPQRMHANNANNRLPPFFMHRFYAPFLCTCIIMHLYNYIIIYNYINTCRENSYGKHRSAALRRISSQHRLARQSILTGLGLVLGLVNRDWSIELFSLPKSVMTNHSAEAMSCDIFHPRSTLC